MMSKEKKLICEALERLQRQIANRMLNKLTAGGICCHVESMAWRAGLDVMKVQRILKDYFTKWPKCVSKPFPVPATVTTTDARHARFLAQRMYFRVNPAEMWLDGEYAQLRQELIQFVLDEIVKED